MSNPAAVTGWLAFGVMIGLSSFGLRKRLAMIPIGRASFWLRLHAFGGALAAALFWLHTGAVWPLGLYERALTACFYLVSASGAAGYALQKIYPPLLTATGVEVIFERIPAELADLRDRAEAIVLACTEETGSDTLSRHYLESMDWFFRRPRFFASHALCGEKGHQWVRIRSLSVSRYLDHKEKAFLNKLSRLAYHKNDVDFHYAAQSVMKGWLFFHIPLSAALLVLALWHVVLVHVYAL